MRIDHFRGEYAFLSNFWEVPVTYKDLTYGSNEAAFQRNYRRKLRYDANYRPL